jgi:uncharacterized membrane protein
MLNTIIFLGLRVLHVLCAATWIGSTAFIALMLVPAVERAGAPGGQVMARIDARGFQTYMALLATTTVVTGLYLIWRFTGGFEGDIAATHAGIAFCLGGMAGVLALIVGGLVVGRSAKQATDIINRAAGMPDGPEKGSLMLRATTARRRMKAGTKVVIALQAAALVLMTVGHYV